MALNKIGIDSINWLGAEFTVTAAEDITTPDGTIRTEKGTVVATLTTDEKGCKPEKLFHFFEDISAIPRGSGNEKGLSDYLVKFAKDRNLWVYQDESNNVIIKKEGSEGAKDKAPVMLQGHIDMVCDKLAGVEHDFEKDGLDLIVKDGVLYANGTTLGADNGVAVALMMTVLDDKELEHPPVECVFTTSEEI